MKMNDSDKLLDSLQKESSSDSKKEFSKAIRERSDEFDIELTEEFLDKESKKLAFILQRDECKKALDIIIQRRVGKLALISLTFLFGLPASMYYMLKIAVEYLIPLFKS